ncbi:nuclear factor 1 C-type-like isoform X2 [Oryctolagus cuniculus]|uniref:nuclear factor 1 C-type-like isoform X2 n=1 Tax=Oryctolagus cuniculus TaxID=9986 RepID=UPI00387A593D
MREGAFTPAGAWGSSRLSGVPVPRRHLLAREKEMDKSPFNSPSPQNSPRLPRFTQHHRPEIATHNGIVRSPHPSSALHFPTTSILQQTASTYFPHRAIRYPPHLISTLRTRSKISCRWPATRPAGSLVCSETESASQRQKNHGATD